MRREIRSLRSDDLDAFLDASHVLWELGDADGKQKFGEDFKSNSFLLGFHQVRATPPISSCPVPFRSLGAGDLPACTPSLTLTHPDLATLTPDLTALTLTHPDLATL